MPYVKPSDETTEKLRGWLILNPNKPRKKLDDGPRPRDQGPKAQQDPSPTSETER